MVGLFYLKPEVAFGHWTMPGAYQSNFGRSAAVVFQISPCLAFHEQYRKNDAYACSQAAPRLAKAIVATSTSNDDFSISSLLTRKIVDGLL